MKKIQSFISDNNVLLVLAFCGVVIHTLFNGQYGFHRDELDILMNARQLDWGYVAYPPVTPLIARIGLELFGNSLQGLRLFSALAQGAVIVLAGLMAKDMGGNRTAQIMAAIAAAIAPAALMAGTLIQYMAFDYLWWVLVAFFTVRLLTTEDPRYWLGIGAAIGLGMMTKFTIAFWVAGLVIAVILTSLRRQLLSKWLWFGVGLALLIYLPNLVWQVRHEMVSLEFLSFIHARDIRWGRTRDFLPEQLYISANPFTFPIWVAGLASCLFVPSMRKFRPLVWMFLVTFALFYVNEGRSYYLSPAYVMFMAAGSSWLVTWLGSRPSPVRKGGTILLFTLLALGGLVGIVVIKPVVPITSPLWETTSEINGEVVEMIGWEDMAAQVAAIYQSIPGEEQARTVILAGNYGEAGALDLYGEEYNLPPVISGANSLWYRGYGDPEPETIIVVGFDRSYAGKFFKQCNQMGTVKNKFSVKNEETLYHSGLYICRQPRRPWSEIWKEMRWYQ